MYCGAEIRADRIATDKCSENAGRPGFGFVQTGATTVPEAVSGGYKLNWQRKRIDKRQPGVYSYKDWQSGAKGKSHRKSS